MLLCYDLCFPPSPSLYSFFLFLSFLFPIVLFSITRDLIPWKFDTLILSPWTWNYLESTILKVYPSLSNPPHLVSWVFDYPKATGTLYYKELPYLTYRVPHVYTYGVHQMCSQGSKLPLQVFFPSLWPNLSTSALRSIWYTPGVDTIYLDSLFSFFSIFPISRSNETPGRIIAVIWLFLCLAPHSVAHCDITTAFLRLGKLGALDKFDSQASNGAI